METKTRFLMKDINRLNSELASSSPQEIISWCWKTFGPHIVSSSSFQTQSVPLLHMIAEACPDMPLIFIDTGYHFPETLAFRDEIRMKFKLNIKTVYPDLKARKQLRSSREPLYRSDPDFCCQINKVEPMARVLREIKAKAWMIGIRHDQTVHRSRISFLELGSDEIIRIQPLLNWKKYEIWRYIKKYNLPVHPLFKKGYKSIGCAPCTRPVYTQKHHRAGRWIGREKTECGLHTTNKNST